MIRKVIRKKVVENIIKREMLYGKFRTGELIEMVEYKEDKILRMINGDEFRKSIVVSDKEFYQMYNPFIKKVKNLNEDMNCELDANLIFFRIAKKYRDECDLIIKEKRTTLINSIILAMTTISVLMAIVKK